MIERPNSGHTSRETIRFLEIWLNSPRIRISDREWISAKWRWEFVRLNEDYQREYEEIEKSGKPRVLPQDHRWGFGEWLDPKSNFEDLYEQTLREVKELGFKGLDSQEAAKFLLLEKLGGPSYRAISPEVIASIDEDGNLETEVIALRVHFGFPASEIKQQVERWIDEYSTRLKKKKLAWDWDKLPDYYNAISLNKQGKSAEEIAQSMFPEPDPLSDDESVPDLNQDSVVRNVYRDLKKGKKLVDGGYMEIR
jgi:hypothetical protein